MTAVTTADIDLLERLVDKGGFASTAEGYIDRTFRRGDKETFYARTLAEKGVEEAERELAEWAKLRFTLASSIEPVVRGIIALARVTPGSLVDITNNAPPMYTQIDDRHGFRRRFVAFNTQVPGCGCMQPEGSYTFGPYGELGLKAVIFEVGRTYEGPKAELTLALPAWGTTPSRLREGEMVLAGIDTDGYNHGSRYTPDIRRGDHYVPFTDSDAFLNHLVGTEPLGGVNAMVTSSGISQVIGFPGAESYLAAQLPRLGDYFVALAEKLSAPHAH